MKSEEETITKFLTKLNVDSVRDVYCIGGNYAGICVCGQPIKYGYKFINKKNKKTCLVGIKCLKFIYNYISI